MNWAKVSRETRSRRAGPSAKKLNRRAEHKLKRASVDAETRDLLEMARQKCNGCSIRLGFVLSVERWSILKGKPTQKQLYRLAMIADRPDLARKVYGKDA